ncbi:MAG: DUF1801 domain-containing protein [Lewinellaceae bacterium]|nr:DUF1801 domain-containing protein [Lewinellaceae bacterium]
MNNEINNYNDQLNSVDAEICRLLMASINKNLEGADSKIWHRHPVWFIDGNPIVGYSKLKNYVRLLFWSGQSFEEDSLISEGKFKAAELRFTHPDEIDFDLLKRILEKSIHIQWDYKNIVKRKGQLLRLK